MDLEFCGMISCRFDSLVLELMCEHCMNITEVSCTDRSPGKGKKKRILSVPFRKRCKDIPSGGRQTQQYIQLCSSDRTRRT